MQIAALTGSVGRSAGFARSEAAQTPAPAATAEKPQEPYFSPVFRFDKAARVLVFQFRDSETGNVTRQYPSEKVVKLYRDNPSMTGPSPGLDISTADIGGSEKLIDQDVRQVGMKLRLVFDCYATPILASSAVTGMLDKVTSLLGTKNQYTFLGYGAGNLVATGASINHLEGEFYELVLETLYDEYFHHSQFAVNASDGRPDMTTSGGVGKYKTVYWARPVRTQADFNSIWPANDIGKNQKYQAYTGRWW